MEPLSTRASEPHSAGFRATGKRFAVALSFPGALRTKASAIADRLAAAIGRDRIFYDKFYDAQLAGPDLDKRLLEIYHKQSDLVVVFLSRDYEANEWCALEGRVVRDLIKSRQSERIMFLRFDNTEIQGLLGIDGYIDARVRSPEELAGLIVDRLKHPQEAIVSHQRVAPPGPIRYLLDRALPGFHLPLTRIGWFPEPPEMEDVHVCLGELKAEIERDVHGKTYLPLTAGDVEARGQAAFTQPVPQHIRQILGIAEGGDSASAQIAAVNRRSRLVKDIPAALLATKGPLVLLGDPGSGKTMTLQQAALALANSELRRVFPRVTLFVPLGEFHAEGDIGPEQVFAHVRKKAPTRLRPWLEGLAQAGRLVLLFDGMDEMSRERYNERTIALSDFADSRRGRIRTLFSCRITDFSTSFAHRRLVLLPFDRAQITAFLRQYLPGPSLTIDGSTWSIHRLARRFSAGDSPVQSSNPFALWLLCLYLRAKRSFPEPRFDLMRYYLLASLERERHKREDAKADDAFPEPAEAFDEWGRFAFAITERNRGAMIPVDALIEGSMDPVAAERMIGVGKSCGILAESIEGTLYQVRFSHHRFQEYFTALYIHRVNPKISWLDKFDAPRWQETLLNLLLLGGGEEAVSALVESITLPVRLHRLSFEVYEEAVRGQREAAEQRETPEKANSPEEELEKKSARDPEPPKIPTEEETVLADRVELGASLLRQAELTSPKVEEALSPCLLDAVDFLIERGNPITQVKMMRACQRLKNIDLLKSLEKPLRSPVQWVRNQALILVAATSTGVRTSRSNLATEMGFDLATNSLLPRWPTYLKALSAMGEARLWWSFLLATFLTVANLALLFTGAGAFYIGGLIVLRRSPSEFLPWIRNFALPMLQRPEAAVVFTLLILGITVIAMKSKPSFAWQWILHGAFGMVVLGFASLGLWHGEWQASLAVVLFYLLLFPVWSKLIAVAGLIAQLSILLAYLGLTSGARSAGSLVSSLSLTWKSCGFAEILQLVVRGVAFLLVALATFAGFLLSILIFGSVGRMEERVSVLLGLPYCPGVTEIAFALQFGLLAWIIVARVRKDLVLGHWVRRLAPGLTWGSLSRWLHAQAKRIIVVSGSIAVGILGAFLLINWLIASRGQWFGPTFLAIYCVIILLYLLKEPIIIGVLLGILVLNGLAHLQVNHLLSSARDLARWVASGQTWVSFGRWLRAQIIPISIFILRALGTVVGVSLTLWLMAFHGQGLVLLILAFLIILLFLILQMLRYAITARWVYSEKSFTPEVWKDLVKQSLPERQQNILLRTHPQALGLTAEEYLQVLTEIELLIQEEPALSAYWDQRDQLDQALRQER
jgi:hypothetical protein